MRTKLIFIFAAIAHFSLYTAKLSFSIKDIGQGEKLSFKVRFDLAQKELVYPESILVTSNNPHLTIATWSIEEKVSENYDNTYQKTKKTFDKNFTIIGTVTVAPAMQEGAIVVQYASNQTPTPQFVFFPIKPRQPINVTQSTPAPTVSTAPTIEPVTCPPQHEQSPTMSNSLQTLIASTTSWWLRIILILLLGILMSLTPCVYPMIPITIGILHGNRKTSLWFQIIRSCCYMLGIALMFAFLGLTAAFTGALFGAWLQKPLIILAITAFLLYLAFSLFDWYDLYMPRFLIKHTKNIQPSGSLVSAFIFGVVSGTVASPCLSPGLAFLLSIVAALGNKFLGFFLLFVFGIGMSIPLLLIGIFAPIIHYLPRAGMWMNEIKKFFGLLLIALSFYFLSMILPIGAVWWLMATSLTTFGIFILVHTQVNRTMTSRKRTLRTCAGLCMLAGATLLYWHALRTVRSHELHQLINWHTTYTNAQQIAQTQHKLLFIDIGAPYCSICKAIDRCVLSDTTIASLINAMIAVHVDTSADSNDYQKIDAQYHIVGVPTILIIDPNTSVCIKRFGAELYTMKKNEIIQELQELLNQKT
jgi:thiol:disulfide interchange protein DsbD